MDEHRHKISPSELQTSLRLIITGITFGITFFTVIGNPVGAPPFTGFIRSLGAGYLIYGIITAMPVLGGILQVIASYYIENTGKRKLLMIISGFVHRLLWIPVALLPLFTPKEHYPFMIIIITILITISSSANSIAGVSFFSWMGELVPENIRGRFFSRRTMISTISAAITSLAVGMFLDARPGLSAFLIVFIVVALLGSVDIVCFIWVKDIPMKPPEKKLPFFKLLLEPFKNKNYIRFTAFISFWIFGVNFAGPFFNVYMLENLKMSYMAIAMFAQVLGNLSTIFFIQKWGRLVDKYGNKPVMTVCCSIIIVLPLFWLFATPQNYWILLLLNFLVGIAWPGYEMTAINLSIWLAPEKNRSIYLASYTLVVSIIGSVFAFILGGAFLEYTKHLFENLSLPFLFGQKFSNFHALFIFTCILRIIPFFLLLPGIREENSFTSREMLSDIKNSIMPYKNFR